MREPEGRLEKIKNQGYFHQNKADIENFVGDIPREIKFLDREGFKEVNIQPSRIDVRLEIGTPVGQDYPSEKGNTDDISQHLGFLVAKNFRSRLVNRQPKKEKGQEENKTPKPPENKIQPIDKILLKSNLNQLEKLRHNSLRVLYSGTSCLASERSENQAPLLILFEDYTSITAPYNFCR